MIVGAGSGGTSLARGLAAAGRSVALVADSLVGGECPYVACMPSKSLLRSARARHEVTTAHEHGASDETVHLGAGWAAAAARRDSVANQRDDTGHAEAIEAAGVTVVRGHGVLDGPGRVRVGDRVLTGTDIVLDTGSKPVTPDVDGLGDVPTWTSDEALSSAERPDRLIVLGGGPIGCELSQAYAAFGTEVTLVDTTDRPLAAEDPVLGDLMRIVLEASGVRLVLGAETVAAEAPCTVVLADGRRLDGDRLLLVAGRRPATADLGVESAGGSLGAKGEVLVDGFCRAADRLWAIGDVTAVAPYTHMANHQARVVLDRLLNQLPDQLSDQLSDRLSDHEPHEMTPDAIPRAVFTDPPLAATGLTEAEARGRGHEVVTAEVDLAETSRAGAEGAGPLGPDDASGGLLRLVADGKRRLLLGAGIVGPEADAWIGEATLAIRAGVSLDVLVDVVRPFPTYAEAYGLGYRQLLDRIDGRAG